jgi:chemotaxis signal transduction protein
VSEALEETVRRLRATFDDAFASPRVERAVELHAVLVVEVAQRIVALRTSQIGGIAARPRILELPGAPPFVVGLTALRGVVLPVCSLAAILGVGGGRSDAWIAWVDADPPAAFAFDRLLGLFQVPAADIVPADLGLPCTPGAARIEGVMRPLVDMAAVATSWARARPPKKEP